ncbi:MULTISPECIES: helix-turn-helix domain-containing protein [Chryseobacterium]|uniref:AraC family transcriptional regulator n=1 Tax=Chryseobacterium candidae TaxID=1978493 RepID=A0ABY2R7J2_9FLAO|nr:MULTISPECIES: AraC family transcriptional regulator [Chryseobacterium]PXW15261.1 helix-turn-helix protein [Chryseobacterium sp. CBTAP 102]THV60507.1 AraC family transcriptional regulator [Chryseobacterium candidae]
MKEKINKYEILFTKYSTLLILIRHIGSLIINWIFGEYLYLYMDIFILCTITPAYILIFHVSTFNFLKLGSITSIYYLILMILYSSIGYSQNLIIILLYIFLFPLGFLFFFNFKKTFILSFSILLIFPLSYLIKIYFKLEVISEQYQTLFNIYTTIFSLVLFFTYLYYFIQTNKLKYVYKYTLNNEIHIDEFYLIKPHIYSFSSNSTEFTNESIYDDQSLYKLLFDRIENYMQVYQPWKSSTYNLNQLAKDLNSNHQYVSFAINKYTENNFKTYLNNYRLKAFIDVAKDKNEQGLFSVKEIYLTVGFDNQATFNRVFKNKYSLTPQEYLNDLKNNNV